MINRTGRRAVPRAVVGVGMTLALLGVVLAGTASAHFLPYDSVDDCEVRWEDETKYDSERLAASSAWESLKGDDCVDLLPDAWDTIADLEWQDVNRSDVSWAGLTRQGDFITGEIHLNDFYMQSYDSCRRTNVAMHELGHIHGLDHSFSGQVMYEFVSPVCTLQSHDITDYQTLWGPRDLPPRTTTTCPRCQEP
jgi:hypothetical protein